MAVDPSTPRKKVVGRDLIRLLAPLFDIETPELIASITLSIPRDDVVVALVEFHADTRLLALDWSALDTRFDGSPEPKTGGKRGSAK